MHFVFRQELHRITPRNSFTQIYQIAGHHTRVYLRQHHCPNFRHVSEKRFINMRWTKPDSLPNFSRAYWLWYTTLALNGMYLLLSSPQMQGGKHPLLPVSVYMIG